VVLQLWAAIVSTGGKAGLPARNVLLYFLVGGTEKVKKSGRKTAMEPADNVGRQLVTELGELGDQLAEREGYEQVSGLEAVWYYLIQKHHWPPKRVRAMHLHDLYFCMKEERL
jgi:hypothetical protein